MARLLVHRTDSDNIRKLDTYLRDQDKKWTLVVRALERTKRYWNQFSANRQSPISILSGEPWKTLKLLKEINPELRTMFIKPPSARNADKIVRYADVSLNSSMITITPSMRLLQSWV
jgi:predicted amino acid racemase